MAAGGDFDFLLFFTFDIKKTYETVKSPREQSCHSVKHRKNGITYFSTSKTRYYIYGSFGGHFKFDL